MSEIIKIFRVIFKRVISCSNTTYPYVFFFFSFSAFESTISSKVRYISSLSESEVSLPKKKKIEQLYDAVSSPSPKAETTPLPLRPPSTIAARVPRISLRETISTPHRSPCLNSDYVYVFLIFFSNIHDC